MKLDAIKLIGAGIVCIVCGYILVNYLSSVPGGGPSISFYYGRYARARIEQNEWEKKRYGDIL